VVVDEELKYSELDGKVRLALYSLQIPASGAVELGSTVVEQVILLYNRYVRLTKTAFYALKLFGTYCENALDSQTAGSTGIHFWRSRVPKYSGWLASVLPRPPSKCL
jgi:hypothetical protein